MNTKNAISLLSLLSIFLLLSCSEVYIEKKEPATDKGVSSNGSYLEFHSQDDFQNAVDLLRNSESTKKKDWLAELNFVSLWSIYDHALAEEMKHNEDMIKQQKNTNDLAEYVKKNESLFNFNDGGQIVGLKVFHNDVVVFLNRDRIVKVAGHFFQYNERNIKIIEKGDFTKISLLNSLNETDERLGVTVIPVENKKSNPSARSNYYHIAQGYGGNDFKITGVIDLVTYSIPIYGAYVCNPCYPDNPNARAIEPGPDPSPCTKTCYYKIIGYNQKTLYKTSSYAEYKNFWGNWKPFPALDHMIGVRWKFEGQLYDYTDNIASLATTGSTANLTIYDGPLLNIIYGKHMYGATDGDKAGVSCEDTFSD